MYQLSIFDAPLVGESSLCIRIPNPVQAAKLRKLAESLQEKIDAKKNPAIAQQRPTRRRASIAEGMYFEAKQLEQIQSWLFAIASSIEIGELPDILRGISSKAQLEVLREISSPSWSELDRKKVFLSDKYADWKLSLKRANIYNWLQVEKAIVALKQLHSEPTEDPIQVQIRRLEAELIGLKIHDFFPTPNDLCDRLVKLAKLKPGMKVLEPSAGKADLAQTILRYHPDVHLDVIEIQENLRRILELKKFNVIGYNFLNSASGEKWDAIIANPPFSEFCEHTYHAYKCLISGGILVTIAPESVFFRSDRKFKEFRQWMTSHNAWDEKVPDGSFLKSANPTGVATRILVVKKLSTL
ncbi:MAG: SAM-dependent DNA methyltransferase [Rhizonema sp. PD38]|nr:SAM-dependent DNA methyltransferase [Rhizonema sp. PD38]